jgi:hypothetical protein
MNRILMAVLGVALVVLPANAATAPSALMVQEALDVCLRWRGAITKEALAKDLRAANWTVTTPTLFSKTTPGGYVALTITGGDAGRGCRLFVRVEDTPWATEPAMQAVRNWSAQALPGSAKTADRTVAMDGGPARAEQWKEGPQGATLLVISRPTKQLEPSSDLIVALDPAPSPKP